MVENNLLLTSIFKFDTLNASIKLTGINCDAGFFFDARVVISRGEFTKIYDILDYIVNRMEDNELLSIPFSDLPDEEGIYKLEVYVNNDLQKTYHVAIIHKLIKQILDNAIKLTIAYDDQTSIKYNTRNYNLYETERVLKAVAKLNGVIAATMLDDFDSAEELINQLKNLLYA